MIRNFGNGLAAAALLASASLAASAGAQAQTVLKVVPHADVRVLDGYVTSAAITAMHMGTVYDTLFAWDEQLVAQPQMVQTSTVSADKLKYTFVLRPGLAFHDGSPVTSKDVVASIKRFVQAEALGRTLQGFMAGVAAIDDKTIELTLKEPFGFTTFALSGVNQAGGIYREKEALTDPKTPITETIGSGPFKFNKSEWVPGAKIAYDKNTAYVPRAEPPSGYAGGKVVKVDRVQYVILPDATTAYAALAAGEVDILDQPSLDLLPTVAKNPDVAITRTFNTGNYGAIRPNHLQPPFDNPKARQALALMVDQREYAQAAYGAEQFWKDTTPCLSFWICQTPFGSEAGGEPYRQQNLAKARQLMQEAGYKGEKIVILGVSDIANMNALTLVTADNLKKIGVNVDLQMMEWGGVVGRRVKKDPADQGGWHMFHTTAGGSSQALPFSNPHTGTTCANAWFGWACDEEAEKLRQAFLRETDPAKQKQIAETLHKRLWEVIPYIPLGQYDQPTLHRKNVTGLMTKVGLNVWWNVEKKS